jgi:hypothetical protein
MKVTVHLSQAIGWSDTPQALYIEPWSVDRGGIH